jgi:1,4-alpha-glucan branching enzyme
VTSSDGNAIVIANDYHWQVNDFGMPPWNELVIYELRL